MPTTNNPLYATIVAPSGGGLWHAFTLTFPDTEDSRRELESWARIGAVLWKKGRGLRNVALATVYDASLDAFRVWWGRPGGRAYGGRLFRTAEDAACWMAGVTASDVVHNVMRDLCRCAARNETTASFQLAALARTAGLAMEAAPVQ